MCVFLSDDCPPWCGRFVTLNTTRKHSTSLDPSSSLPPSSFLTSCCNLLSECVKCVSFTHKPAFCLRRKFYQQIRVKCSLPRVTQGNVYLLKRKRKILFDIITFANNLPCLATFDLSDVNSFSFFPLVQGPKSDRPHAPVQNYEEGNFLWLWRWGGFS